VSAFLGLKIWDQAISLSMNDDVDNSEEDEFSVMNIDDFLTENSVDMEDEPEDSKAR